MFLCVVCMFVHKPNVCVFILTNNSTSSDGYVLVMHLFFFQATGFAVLGLGVWMQVTDTHAESYMEIFNDATCDQCSSAIEYFRVS